MSWYGLTNFTIAFSEILIHGVQQGNTSQGPK